MAICEKGHYYNLERNPSCPLCARLAGGNPRPGGDRRPRTDGAPAPRTQIPTGGRPQPNQGGAQRTMLVSSEENEKLMGFLVVDESRQHEHHEYFRLKHGVNIIGRSSKADLTLKDDQASSRHLILVCRSNGTHLIDLDSMNKVFINGDEADVALLEDGDRLRIGRTELIYVSFGYEAED